MLLSFTESSTTEIETYSHLLQSEERESSEATFRIFELMEISI